MISLLRRHFPRFLLIWGLGAISAGLGLVLPKVTIQLTSLLPSEGVPVSMPTRMDILIPIGLLLAAYGFRSLILYLNTLFDFQLEERVIKERKRELFRRVARFRPAFFRQYDLDALLNRINNDDEQVQNLKLQFLKSIPIALISLAIYTTFLFSENWLLALVVAPLSLLNGLFLIFDKQIQRIMRRGREVFDELRSAMREYLLGIEEARRNGTFAYTSRRLNRTIDEQWIAAEEVAELRAQISTTGPVIAAVQDGGLYLVGALLCLATMQSENFWHPTTWGQVLAFLMTAGLYKQPVKELFGQVMQWRLTKASLDRVSDLEREPEHFPDPGRPGSIWNQTRIGMKEASVEGDQGNPILKRISLEVDSGQKIALVGPSGCGKSTTLRILIKGIDPSEGEAVINEMRLDELSIYDIASNAGVVPQEPYLIHDDIRENILFGLRREGARVLNDANGPLCLDRHPEIDSLEGLDRELVQVTESVGLTEDLEVKALDLGIQAGGLLEPLESSRESIRRRVTEAIHDACGDGVIQPFDLNEMIPSASLGLNLFFGLEAAEDGKNPAEIFGEMARELPEVGDFFESQRDFLLGYLRENPHILMKLPPAYTDLRADLAKFVHGPSSRLPKNYLQLLFILSHQIPVRACLQDEELEKAILKVRNVLVQSSGRISNYRHYASDPPPDSMTLREYLLNGQVSPGLLGLEERVDTILIAVLKEAGLGNRLVTSGLKYRVGSRGEFLSGGQRQKIALARAFLKRPSLLLLDEATSALDELSQQRIVNLIESKLPDTTVLLISHRLNTIRGMDRIFVFDRGQIVQSGTYPELVATEGLFRAMVRGDEPPITKPSDGVPESDADILKVLASIPLLSPLSLSKLTKLAASIEQRRCASGTLIFEQGSAPDGFYMIESGEVGFYPGSASPEADRIRVCGPGEVFGEIAIFSQETRTLAARAETDCRLLVMNADSLLSLVREDGEIALPLLKLMSQRASADSRRAADRDS